ncbi:MAG TPA: tetratricopeptide repeat protein, partial [Gallionellaceae bacterium]|nr:tetratricopeptide repeat protein [Gallionellaceae bacterium]
MFAWLKKTLTQLLKAPRAPLNVVATSEPGEQAVRQKESAVYKSQGDKYFDYGKFENAAVCYRQAIAINPDFAEAFDNLGIALWQQKLYGEAEHCLKQAILINPGMASTHYNLGSLLREQGKLNEALRSFGKALEIKPYFAEAHNYMGVVLKELGRLSEAVSSFRRALEHDPEYYTAKAQMVHEMQQLCEWSGLEADIQSVRQGVLESQPSDRRLLHPFASLSLTGATAVEQKRYAERYAQIEYQHLAALRSNLGFEFNHSPNEKIHIGYLSADFRQHPVSFLMAEIFELHDRNRFHITAYSYGPDDGSAMRKRLEKAFDSFVDIRDNTYESAARKIYADHIDILVDLTCYTKG